MSYCRWSSDNCHCDLYCYESVYGYWVTHVARNRIISPLFPQPRLSWLRKGRFEKFRAWLWLVAYRFHGFTVRIAIRRPIGLPSDGMTYNDDTLDDFAIRLLQLRIEGYRFPDYVMEAVNEEIAERNKSTTVVLKGLDPAEIISGDDIVAAIEKAAQ